MTKYEKYQLEWMLVHGYSLADLMRELTDMQYEDPDYSDGISMPVTDLFSEWEADVGFGGELWACEKEFKTQISEPGG